MGNNGDPLALSNWDTLALDHTGQPSDGSYTSPAGVTVAIYKNWLYIRDPKAWREAGNYIEPTVLDIKEGQLTYMDVHILAVRGPQEGVYVAAWSHPVVDGQRQFSEAHGMVGCGVYGFEGSAWVGVTEKSAAYLRAFLERPDLDFFPFEFTDEQWAGATRYCQGDAFIGSELGLPTPTTLPGEAGPTYFDALIQGIKPSGRNR